MFFIVTVLFVVGAHSVFASMPLPKDHYIYTQDVLVYCNADACIEAKLLENFSEEDVDLNVFDSQDISTKMQYQDNFSFSANIFELGNIKEIGVGVYKIRYQTCSPEVILQDVEPYVCKNDKVILNISKIDTGNISAEDFWKEYKVKYDNTITMNIIIKQIIHPVHLVSFAVIASAIIGWSRYHRSTEKPSIAKQLGLLAIGAGISVVLFFATTYLFQNIDYNMRIYFILGPIVLSSILIALQKKNFLLQLFVILAAYFCVTVIYHAMTISI